MRPRQTISQRILKRKMSRHKRAYKRKVRNILREMGDAVKTMVELKARLYQNNYPFISTPPPSPSSIPPQEPPLD
jgi:hypothetical protein